MKMKEFIKKNFIVLLAFLLPVILIVVVALSAYIPSFLLKTDYNFIYTSCSDGINRNLYSCNNYLNQLYSVENNKLAVNEINPKQDSDGDGVLDIDENYNARIFLHDTKKNESREVALEEAQGMMLNGLLTSPDGVTVSSDWDRGGDFFFIFDGGSSYGYYLTKGRSKSKLHLINADDRYYYRDNFQFIGWVLPGSN